MAGLGYTYLDNENIDWKYPGKFIKDEDNALAYTMKQLYDNSFSEDFMFLSYNDESPNGKEHESMGHTKGVLMSNKSTGAWLIHSLPRFPAAVSQNMTSPNKLGGYIYPPNGAYNGQVFLCVSFDYSQIFTISQLIYYDTPYIHDKNVPDEFMVGNKYLKWLSQNKDITTDKNPPWTLIKTFHSLRNKTPFVAFAKYKKFDADIYSDLIAPYYQSNLLSETWQQDTKHALNSSCFRHPTVQNIKGISFNINSNDNKISDSQRNISFSEFVDHSKWAVTNPKSFPATSKIHKNSNINKPVVCIGDLNRELHQEKRSGGMVCTENLQLWNSFRQIINDIEACPLRSA
ncbi:plancitoxin-1-like [Gordionus sp. m RMFG-2023]|uniref:plancitoxin-1-like n=1 Tax=Gordionus sp. m RMFG-2023 TaxID=3053472 RepID=UPI0031FBDB2B